MIDIIQNTSDSAKLDAILARTPDFSAEREAAVREIVAAVKERGEKYKRGRDVNLCRRACQTTARTGLRVESLPLIRQGDYCHAA